jgi:hypothetical protein
VCGDGATIDCDKDFSEVHRDLPFVYSMPSSGPIGEGAPGLLAG